MVATINLPRILRVGAGASGQLVATLAELGLARPLLVTDPFIKSCGYCERLQVPLEAAGITYGLFSECVPDPTTDSVYAALAMLQAGDYDCVVALGGGSSLDTAKAVAVLAKHGGLMRDYKVPRQIDSGLPIIAIPTTAGTGSEATRVAVITDTETCEKMLCMGLGLMPVAALVDFELTLTMPYRLTADTGIDSLCHALEAYVSRKANPFTDSIALTAMRTIYQNIRTACAEPDNRQAREAMMLAATQGGDCLRQCLGDVDPRYESPDRCTVSCAAWPEQCHVAAGGHRLVGRPRPRAICALCALYGHRLRVTE